MRKQLKVGDVVRVLAPGERDTTFFNEPNNSLAYIYETYTICLDTCVSVITENGVDLGCFFVDEQEEYLIYVSTLDFVYNFRSESWLEYDWEMGIFAPFIDEVMELKGI